jgi:hypothetical protein
MKSRSSASRYLPMKGQTMDITIAKTPRQAANTAVPLNTIKAVGVPPDGETALTQTFPLTRRGRLDGS